MIDTTPVPVPPFWSPSEVSSPAQTSCVSTLVLGRQQLNPGTLKPQLGQAVFPSVFFSIFRINPFFPSSHVATRAFHPSLFFSEASPGPSKITPGPLPRTVGSGCKSANWTHLVIQPTLPISYFLSSFWWWEQNVEQRALRPWGGSEGSRVGALLHLQALPGPHNWQFS